MEKKILFLFCLLLVDLNIKSQEFMLLGGAGLQNKEDGDVLFEFAETRLMFGHSSHRFGPCLSVVQYERAEPKFLLGREFKFGLSYDHYWKNNFRSNYYWLNSQYGISEEFFMENDYQQFSRDGSINFSGGYMSSDDWGAWFSGHRLLFNYSKPINIKSVALFDNKIIIPNDIYSKESLRIVYENGIKSIGSNVKFQPLLHLGFYSGNGFDPASINYEAGLGFNIGFYKDWYRDIVKVKVFQSFNQQNSNFLSGEVVFNVTNLLNIMFK